MEEKELSKQTLVVLVALVVLVSVLGTFTVMNEAGKVKVVEPTVVDQGTSSSQGRVSLTIAGAEGAGAYTDSTTARVALTIVPRED